METDLKTLTIPDFFIFLTSLKNLGRTTLTEIQHETKITYAHLHNIKKGLLQKEWISQEKEGVQIFISLTGSGFDVEQAIRYLLDKMNITKEDIIKFRQKTKRGNSRKNDGEKNGREDNTTQRNGSL